MKIFRHAMHCLFSFAAFAVSLAATAAGTITYYHNDVAGSPLVATNEAGQVIWRESYRPYGERLANSAASTGNDIWLTSRRQDLQTGLVYMGARYYDPVIGRFISTDPKQFDEQNPHLFNRYAYANDNPYKFQDPDGRNPILIAMGIGALIGGGVNAVSQYVTTGTVRWGGLGGVIDAAGDGMLLGLAGARTGAAAQSADVNIAKSGSAAAAGEVSAASTAKSIRSLERRIAEHEQKLAEYKANPDAFDNKGFLQSAPSQEVRERIIQGRIDHLEGEIANFRRQVSTLKGTE